VGVALLCFAGFGGPQRQVLQLSHAFLFVYNLTAGRVKLKLLKMKKSMFTAFALGLCLTANLMAQVPNYVPTNGLVGWWPFNGNANDESGNGNNGTVNGATLTTDRFGVANKAYSFDGVNDFIDNGNNSNLNFVSGQSKTFSFWANRINGEIPVITKYQNYSSNSNYAIGTGNNQFGIIGNGTNSLLINDSLIGWNHYLVILTPQSSAQLFINGYISLTGLLNFSTFQSNWPFFIGKVSGLDIIPELGSYEDYYGGRIDDIGIWNRVLSECEIQDLYNAQLGSFSNSSASINPTSSSIGSNATLTVSSPVSSLQWQSNPGNMGWNNVVDNGNYTGATNDTLVVSNLQLSNHNQPFRVLACGDTSNIATIQIADTCITTISDTLYTTVTDTLIINTTLSLPAPNNENTIMIYPNPASDHITIDNGNFAAMAGYTIKIENNAGQQVFQSAINQAQFYVDLSTWTGNGLYFVHLIDPQNNTVTVRKIVLQ
jgi:hypothetical protein